MPIEHVRPGAARPRPHFAGSWRSASEFFSSLLEAWPSSSIFLSKKSSFWQVHYHILLLDNCSYNHSGPIALLYCVG